jgi:hypothetical protein
MRRNTFNTWFALPIVLALPFILSAQAPSPPQSQILLVNGQAGKTSVVHVNGRTYIDVEALAQVGNGSFAITDHQITLTIPPPSSAAPGQQTPPGFSKDFLSASVESIAAIREWRTAIATAIRNSISVTDDWVTVFRGRANDSLRQASVAAVSSTDRAALQLLTNEYNNMQKWSDQIIASRAKLQYMSPAEVNSDPLFQQILTCSHSLASMVGSGQYQDEPSCH